MSKTRTLHHILEQLRNLQVVLNEKFQLEKKLVGLPRDVELKEQMVFRMKENYLVADEQYQELKKKVGLKQDEIDRLQSHREKYEKEIAQVSSQRDYEQIDRAIKENLEQELVMRSEFNVLESKLKAFTEEYNSTEALLKDQESELVELKKELDSQYSVLENELKSIKEKEKVLSSNLDDRLVFKFERIIKSKGGDGIVAVRNNICTGCHMILPLQFVNLVCKEEDVLNCPYCSKILYHDDIAEEEEIEQVETAGLQDLFEDEDIELDDFDEEDYEIFMEKDNIGSDNYAVPTEDDMNDDDDDDEELDDDIDDLEDDDELEEDN